jgi:hypothetical protein
MRLPAPDQALWGSNALFLEHWYDGPGGTRPAASVDRLRILRCAWWAILQRAEDLALEAFLRLYRHNQKHAQVENAGGWLYQVSDPARAELHTGLEAPGTV